MAGIQSTMPTGPLLLSSLLDRGSLLQRKLAFIISIRPIPSSTGKGETGATFPDSWTHSDWVVWWYLQQRA